MAKRFTYWVRLENGKQGRTNNKAEAIAAVKKHGGKVLAQPYHYSERTYDYPTFAIGAKEIFKAPKPRNKKKK